MVFCGSRVRPTTRKTSIEQLLEDIDDDDDKMAMTSTTNKGNNKNDATLAQSTSLPTTAKTAATRGSATAAAFCQTKVSCLTREEECLLKTALAMVVVRKRCQLREIDDGKADDNHSEETKSTKGKKRKSPAVSIINDDDEGVDTTTSNNKKKKKKHQPLEGANMNTRLLDTLFSNPPGSSLSSGSSQLLQIPHRVHINQMFCIACSMITNNSNSNGSASPALDGTACHLAQQLQVWLATMDLPQEQDQEQDDTHGEAVVSSWIQTSLLSHPNACRVYQAMIPYVFSSKVSLSSTTSSHDGCGGVGGDPQAPPRLAATILWVVATLLQQVYNDDPSLQLPTTTTTNGTTIDSLSSNATKHRAWGFLATSLLRLLSICLLSFRNTRNEDSTMAILQECWGDGDLLVPLPVTKLGFEYWKLAKLSSRIPPPLPPSSQPPRPRQHQKADNFRCCLDPGSKLLIRLTLYRMIVQQIS